MYVTLRGLRIISPSFTECGGRGGPRIFRPTLEHFITEAIISEVQNCAQQKTTVIHLGKLTQKSCSLHPGPFTPPTAEH